MSKINSYFISQKNDEIKLLMEILDKNNGNLSTFYYEIILKINGGSLDNRYYELKSIKEIFNIFEYLYSSFKGNIKKRRIEETTTDYLVKLLILQSYKKGLNNRLLKRLMIYNRSKINDEEDISRTK
jgi:hypothetical protein